MVSIITCTIRVNEESWEKLKEIAKINKRSMNKEIEFIIDKRIEEFESKENKKDKEYEKMEG